MGKAWTILALALLMPCAAIRLSSEDGGYSGIVVAIHESVPYNPSILANIEVYANSCSGNRKFTAATSTGEKCKLYRYCRLAEDCIVNFHEDETNPSMSSIMFLPYLKHVKQFCTKEQHNSLWVNPQNSVCRGKSTAEVVEASDDYKT